MGIFSFSKNTDKEKNKLVLVFDLGSSSVGGSLFWMQESGIPKIVMTRREPVPLEEEIDPNRFLSLAIKSLESVADHISLSGLGAPQKIFCVLSSPWYVSQTRIINLEKNVPFIFNSKLADELVKKEISLFKEGHLAKYLDRSGGVRLIEFKNIKTVLNGYEVLNPLDQKAKELEMTIFLSISGDQILRKIEETIGRHFNFESLKFSSFLLSSFAVVRDMYIQSENFLLVNIGGEVTDISMVKKNILRESISFPFGSNFMIRGVASALHSSLDEAKSLVSLFKDGHAGEEALKTLGPAMDNLKNKWLEKFQKSLSNLSNDISVPATIYLTVDKDLADFFSDIIKREQFNQYTLTESKFKIIFLNSENLHGLAEFDGNAVRDPALVIESIYVNRFLNKI